MNNWFNVNFLISWNIKKNCTTNDNKLFKNGNTNPGFLNGCGFSGC